MALFDSARPYSIAFTGAGTEPAAGPGRFGHLIYQIPRAALDARSRTIATATAVRVPANGGAGQLVSRYLRAVAAPGWSPGDRMTAHAFTDTGLDLVISALRAACGQDELASDREQMTADLKRHALTNLGDRGLTPAAAARASYILVRQLHRLFAREGLSFAAWVHEQRLRHCRDDLADRSLAHLAIAEVATRWGFRSAAHFSRAFAARCGVTPSEFRQAGLSSEPPAGRARRVRRLNHEPGSPRWCLASLSAAGRRPPGGSGGRRRASLLPADRAAGYGRRPGASPGGLPDGFPWWPGWPWG
jgi:AraC-like DNA-binding protein